MADKTPQPKPVVSKTEFELTKLKFDLLVKNYSFFAERTKLFFTNIYNTIHFTIIFYGGMLVLLNAFSGYKTEVQRITFTLLVFYAIPGITYILGLFYGYNSLHLYRLGKEEINIENQIESLAKDNGFNFSFSKWEHKTKQNPGFRLAYGTMLMFYILAPFGIMVVFDVLILWPRDCFFWLAQVILPAVMFSFYVSFMVYLICQMLKTQMSIKGGAKTVKGGAKTVKGNAKTVKRDAKAANGESKSAK